MSKAISNVQKSDLDSEAASERPSEAIGLHAIGAIIRTTIGGNRIACNWCHQHGVPLACNWCHHPETLTDRVRKTRDELRLELEYVRACIRYVPDEGANQPGHHGHGEPITLNESFHQMPSEAIRGNQRQLEARTDDTPP